MSIPRAKITYGPGSIPTSHWWFYRCASCGTWGRRYDAADAMGSAHRHLLEEHGVRTVGSLTADDIGKWIEVEGREPLRLDYVSHSADGLSVINDGEYRQLNIDGPSTPCRVTEERP